MIDEKRIFSWIDDIYLFKIRAKSERLKDKD